MPDKNVDIWLWLYGLLTSQKMTLAFWAGVGGGVRIIVMHRQGASSAALSR